MNTYLKIIIPIVAALVLTMVFFHFIQKGEENYHVHKINRVDELFNKNTKYDVVFLGSSRTHTSIIPRIVDSVSGLNTYNAGVEGGTLFEFNMTLEGFLANHPPPSMLFLNIDAHSFDLNRKLFFPLQYFKVLDNPAVSKTFRSLDDYKMVFIEHLPFMRVIYYDDYAKRLSLAGLLGNTELSVTGDFEDKGFMSNGVKCADTVNARVKHDKAVVDTAGVALLEDMIELCRQKNISVVLTYSPEYDHRLKEQYSNFDGFMTTLTSLANKHKLPLFRDDTLSLSGNRCYFANYGHLNTAGAVEYSRLTGERIRDLATAKTSSR